MASSIQVVGAPRLLAARGAPELSRLTALGEQWAGWSQAKNSELYLALTAPVLGEASAPRFADAVLDVLSLPIPFAKTKAFQILVAKNLIKL